MNPAPSHKNEPVTRSFAQDFVMRHIGPHEENILEMLKFLSFKDLPSFIEAIIPETLHSKRALKLSPPETEDQVLKDLEEKAAKNIVFTSYLGMGYHDVHMPSVIERLIFQDPAWYTSYTPYQAEISQGRLEMLLNFQQMIIDLTGLPFANASLLDEATAAAEAMSMIHRVTESDKACFLVDHHAHPQTIELIKTRALPLNIQPLIGDPFDKTLYEKCFGVFIQYPTTLGDIHDYQEMIKAAHDQGLLVAVAADLLALTLIASPGELGADIAVGTTQRFGMPLGYGGPHAAYFACREDFKRNIPGRLIGVSVDAKGRKALRMALQTREQHIRREKATSNICTAQALPAILSTAYALYMGPERLKEIALDLHTKAIVLQMGLQKLGFECPQKTVFDTVLIKASGDVAEILSRAEAEKINLRQLDQHRIIIALNNTTTQQDVETLWQLFKPGPRHFTYQNLKNATSSEALITRKSLYLTHEVFNRYHTETEFMRYIKHLEMKDLALDRSMIPLGSCTMKLNAATELKPVTWSGFNALHPFVPKSQAKGYQALFNALEADLAEITGFDGVSLQPNSGAQGEFAGLMAIKAYHESRNEKRHICFIPSSAHGTNPASAKMAGLHVIVVRCDKHGNVDIEDLKRLCAEHKEKLSCMMMTYPSTHGVFEPGFRDICHLIHEAGGQVYIDGANLNAMIGHMRFGELGGDVCHMNLHKTFCIPHGGGGPGVGPIGVKSHLIPFLPKTDIYQEGTLISAAPHGSASILPISYAYIRMMGAEGLTQATSVALLSANYIARKLKPYYPVLYTDKNGYIAHECIIDIRPFKDQFGISNEDVAKRLVDYGFHAPTVSFPVSGTLMIEPTESESKFEIDRFIEAMIAIHAEIQKIANGTYDKDNNPLKRAPHTIDDLLNWDRPYTQEEAVFPSAHTKTHKYWPPVNRIDNDYGDRNLFCACM